MSRLPRIALLVALSLVAGCSAPRATGSLPQTARGPAWQVCFSPRGGCTQLIVDTVAGARSTILVQAYSFTSEPIAHALVDAHQRGVDIAVILDKSQRTEDDARIQPLVDAGIPVLIDAAHAIAHNKVMVIDGTTVITGSFNFTQAAEERNAENLLVIRDAALAAQYTANWRQHQAHSQRTDAVQASP